MVSGRCSYIQVSCNSTQCGTFNAINQVSSEWGYCTASSSAAACPNYDRYEITTNYFINGP